MERLASMASLSGTKHGEAENKEKKKLEFISTKKISLLIQVDMNF